VLGHGAWWLDPVTDRHPGKGPLVEAEGLKVHFPLTSGILQRRSGAIRAVDGVTCLIRRGDTLGLVGESGCGKSTLGRALIRLREPTDGQVRFDGLDLTSLSAQELRRLRRRMQIIFQDPYGSLSPRMSVADIVAEGLVVQGAARSRAERRAVVAKALTDVGLDPAAMDRYPHEFSGGQRQRIAIARAMVLNPRFVVLDEPTSALDRSVQAQIVTLLRDLQRERGLAYLFISHDLKVVRALANYVIVMQNGHVVEEGAAETIFANPRTPYTRALFKAAFALESDAAAELESA